MGWIAIGIGLINSFLYFSIGRYSWMAVAIALTVVSFWSLGVMHNYASYAMRDRADRIRRNAEFEGPLSPLGEKILADMEQSIDPQAAPNWATYVCVLAFLGSVTLGVAFWFVR